MGSTEIYSIGAAIQIIYGTLLITCSYIAIKKFRIIVWKPGWYLIILGGLFIVFFSVLEMLMKPTQTGLVFFDLFQPLLTHGLIAVGILFHALNAEKIWGEAKDKKPAPKKDKKDDEPSS